MSPWSLESIQRRIRNRLAELNLTVEDLPNTIRKGFDKGWKQGPTLQTLQRVADKLQMSLPDLLGVPLQSSGNLDQNTLRQALLVVSGAIPPLANSCPLQNEPEKLADVIGQAYRMIAVMMRDQPELAQSEGALYSVASHLRYLWAKDDSQKS